MDNLHYLPFGQIDLNAPFFDSLRADYAEFNEWFHRKMLSGDRAYVLITNGCIEGFMYTKVEHGVVHDVSPPINANKSLKIGTFKFEASGTRRGQRFLKKAIDEALFHDVDYIYVTMFSKQEALMGMMVKYGFSIHGEKATQNGTEFALVKNMRPSVGSTIDTYPHISVQKKNHLMLGIHPQYHTKLFPDSILKNENANIVQDISHTNSIHKIYITNIENVKYLSPGNTIVIYRTKEGKIPAWYSSVATSICVFEEYKHINEFGSFEEFHNYCAPYSVFGSQELNDIWRQKKYCYIIRFMYNLALSRRLNQQMLVENVGVDKAGYWGAKWLSDTQLREIARLGGINESLIVD